MNARERIMYREKQRKDLAIAAEVEKLRMMSPFKVWAQEQALKFIKYGDQKTLGVPRVPEPEDIYLPF